MDRPSAAHARRSAGEKPRRSQFGTEFESQHLQRAVVTQRVQVARVPAQYCSTRRRRGTVAEDTGSERRMRKASLRLGKSPRIGRRDCTDQIMRRDGHRPPIDGAIARAAATEVAAGGQVLLPARCGAGDQPGQAAVQRHLGGYGDLAENFDRRVIRQYRHRLLPDDVAGIGFGAMTCNVAPVSLSPFSTAQLTGARPRYFGSSEPCML